MILVDTGIWIEFLRGNTQYQEHMAALLEEKEICTIDPIFAELLYGAKTNNEKNTIISYWQLIPKVFQDEHYFIDAAIHAFKNNYRNLGVGLIDSIIIHAALVSDSLVWTLDKKILSTIDKKIIYSINK
jgi:predicted nucleic acid-binding protein